MEEFYLSETANDGSGSSSSGSSSSASSMPDDDGSMSDQRDFIRQKIVRQVAKQIGAAVAATAAVAAGDLLQDARRWPQGCRSDLRRRELPASPVATVAQRLQPALCVTLAVVAVARVPFYRHWDAEVRSSVPFVAAMLFMLAALLFEALSVLFVTIVLCLAWHR
ncbi:hypothetical protein Acr_11g0007730 [Actinidia rufa]|uniref:Uncharacterized protein n=1 Tax=Actinidia rufa TaxID=165716 RepID=A0A7J0FEZ3_9ERIC|nr:hypothetical protein Acr_11g0007730 [Actinidia rufa]